MLCLRPASLVGILGVALATGACGGSSPTAASETFIQKSESYSGTLNPGETAGFHFTVENPGSLDASIASLSPISTLTMGLQLGSWDAVTETCPRQLYTEGAKVNSVLTGNPQGPGEYCVAIYDIGNLQSPTDFALTVLHY